MVIGSFLEAFLPNATKDKDLLAKVSGVLEQSNSKTIQKTKDLLNQLPQEKWADFFKACSLGRIDGRKS